MPSYKPKVNMHAQGPDDRPIRGPYIEGEYLVIGYLFDTQYKLTSVQEEAWLNGELDSPPRWYILRMKFGDNPNRSSLKGIGSDDVPSDIDDLYTSFWQVRIALEHPSAREKISQAEYLWVWFQPED